MPALTPAISAWLATHHGVVTFHELRQLGLSADQIQHLVRTGVLNRYANGVYCLAAVARTDEQSLALACAVAPDVVVAFRSAARMWALRGLGTDRQVHVVIPWGRERVIPGAVVHRSTLLAPG